MKTIAIDLTSLNDNFSGIEHYALYITKELIKNSSFQFYLIFKNRIQYFKDEEIEHDNIKSIILNGRRLGIMLFDLPKLINRLKPDYCLFLAFPPSIFFRPKKGIHVFSMIHDTIAWDCPETMTFKSRFYFRKAIKHAIKISTKLITNSKFSKQRIIDLLHVDENRISIAYCASAMNTTIQPFEIVQQKYKLPNHYVLTLSTVEPRKNIPFLLRCMDYLWNHEDNIPKLVIAGRKGWKTDKLLEGISEKGKSNIVFTGFIDDDDIASIYHYSQFFIFPSIYEGFGIPVLESLQAGRLPLCSDIPTNREILGEDYPYLFDPRSKEGFVNAMRKMLSNTDEKEIDFELIKNRIKKFDWLLSSYQILENII